MTPSKMDLNDLKRYTEFGPNYFDLSEAEAEAKCGCPACQFARSRALSLEDKMRLVKEELLRRMVRGDA